MNKLQWVDTDKVGGKKAWGDQERVAIGTTREKQIRLKSGKTETVTETIIAITRFPNGAHAIETQAPIPESERPKDEG